MATYARPVCPGTPTEFAAKIANTTFGEIFLAGQSPMMWEWFNDFYICEAYFYSEYRAACPVPTCEFYWGEVEYPEDPSTTVGNYGLLIEYLGDDLKIYDMVEGAPTEAIQDALQTVAKLHAATWNDESLLPIKDGGTNFYINAAEQTGKCFQTFIGQEPFAQFHKHLATDESADPRLAPIAKVAYATMHQWLAAGCTENRTLASFDLRAENLIWRCTNSGQEPAEYECVPIDHQGWWLAPPTRDITMLCLSSLKESEVAGQFEGCLKIYYDALVASGVADYSYEQYMTDVKASCWVCLLFAAIIHKMAVAGEETVEAMTGDEDNYEEAKTMHANMVKMRDAFDIKARLGIEAVGAYDQKEWFESFQARPIRDEDTELTPAWLTTALKERGHLPRGVRVESMEFLNLGEGRGYAGKTLKIFDVKYTGPTDLPDVFVMKIPNYMMESIDWGKTIFSMCDLGFRQENYFYDKLHAKHPIALPKMFWIGEEPNPSPETTMPRASILMEIVPDPAMISQIEGTSESDGREFLTALAKIQAVHWNSEELAAADWLMSSDTIGTFKQGVVAEALPRLRGIPEFMALEYAEEFLALLERATPQIATLNAEASAHGKTLCHGDARTENCLWPNQRTEGIVIIDWQFISFANPMTDLCCKIVILSRFVAVRLANSKKYHYFRLHRHVLL